MRVRALELAGCHDQLNIEEGAVLDHVFLCHPTLHRHFELHFSAVHWSHQHFFVSMMTACVCVSRAGHKEADGTKKKTDRSANPGAPGVWGTDGM